MNISELYLQYIIIIKYFWPFDLSHIYRRIVGYVETMHLQKNI